MATLKSTLIEKGTKEAVENNLRNEINNWLNWVEREMIDTAQLGYKFVKMFAPDSIWNFNLTASEIKDILNDELNEASKRWDITINYPVFSWDD